MTVPVVKRPQEDPVMTRSRITTSLLASLMALSLAGAPAAFARPPPRTTWANLTR